MTTKTTTFDLEVVTDKPCGAYVRALFEAIGVTVTMETLDGVTNISTENFLITAFDGAEDALSCELGIEPTVFVQFRPRPTLVTDVIAIKRLLTALNHWMGHISNDFALVADGETVMMYRTNCELFLNTASPAWTTARQSLITTDYTTVEMPPLADVATS